MNAQFLSSSPKPGIVSSSVPFKADSISERKLHGEVSESGDPDDDRLVGGKVKIVEVMIPVLLFAVDLKGRISTGNRVGLMHCRSVYHIRYTASAREERG